MDLYLYFEAINCVQKLSIISVNTMFLRIALLFFVMALTQIESKAQFLIESMRAQTKLSVTLVPFPRLAHELRINSYEFIGKTERALQAIGVEITAPTESQAVVLIDLDMKSTSIGIAYVLRIRFIKKLSGIIKGKSNVSATSWERSYLNFSTKLNTKNSILNDYEILLKTFLADYSDANQK